MTFSNTLKQARESLGMTQMELSRALGVSFSTINRYENGKHRPTPIVMKAIQNLFASEGIPFVLDSDMEACKEKVKPQMGLAARKFGRRCGERSAAQISHHKVPA